MTTTLLDIILNDLRAEYGDRIAVITPEARHLPRTLPDLVIIDDRHDRGPEAFGGATLDRALTTAKIFWNEGVPDTPDWLPRFRSICRDMLAAEPPEPCWGTQVLRPPGPGVLLVTKFRELDCWIDKWESHGIHTFTGRDLLTDFRDAAGAATEHDLDFDEALGRLGWRVFKDVTDPQEWPF